MKNLILHLLQVKSIMKKYLLIITVIVELPKSLDKAQKLLIQKLDEDIKANQYTKKKQYNDKLN